MVLFAVPSRSPSPIPFIPRAPPPRDDPSPEIQFTFPFATMRSAASFPSFITAWFKDRSGDWRSARARHDPDTGEDAYELLPIAKHFPEATACPLVHFDEAIHRARGSTPPPSEPPVNRVEIMLLKLKLRLGETVPVDHINISAGIVYTKVNGRWHSLGSAPPGYTNGFYF